MMLHTKNQGSRTCGFRQEDFFMFLPILVFVKHVTPGVIFGPRGIILTNLLEVHTVMLHTCTKYQSSRPYCFRQEDFFHVSPHMSLCKTCDP